MEQCSEREKQWILSFYDDNPYVKHLRMKVEEIKSGSATISMVVAPDTHTNVYHVAHGGALMSAGDTAMGAACLTLHKKVVTLEMNINCVKAVPENIKIFAASHILHDGARTLVAECDITDDAGNLYAKLRGTFFVIEKFTF